MTVTSRNFGRLPDGRAATLYTIEAPGRLVVSVSNYGGIVTSVRAPDRNGAFDEITLAYDTLEEYLSGHPYFGATVGRVANRVSGGGFELDGHRYDITRNQGTLHLHGGSVGFDKHLFSSEPISDNDRAGVRLTLVSPDGDEGYPGELTVAVTITVDATGTLSFHYRATTTSPTPVNVTNHTYWNLAGVGTILAHLLQLHSDHVVAVDRESVPAGELVEVAGTPFDFRAPKAIGRDFAAVAELPQGGYDHCYAIRGWSPGEPATLLPVAEVWSTQTGRRVTVRSTCPGVQFYSGNNLAGWRGRSGETLTGQEAFCLETQFYPDSVNRPEFPSTILRPGETWDHRTEYAFAGDA